MDHSSGKCQYCDKNFANCKLKNSHIKRVHRIVVENSRKSYILCPFCEEGIDVKTYENLRNHLEENHRVSIEKLTLQFSSNEEYEVSKNAEKIETNYAMHRASQLKDHKEVYYECNKSDTRGGKANVNFWKTHAGHDEKELRNKHLLTTEKEYGGGEIEIWGTNRQNFEDARKLEMPKLERINLLSRDDVTYLSKKYNIDKKRDSNEMVAAALKVQEWSEGGKNFAFLFKQEDSLFDLQHLEENPDELFELLSEIGSDLELDEDQDEDENFDISNLCENDEVIEKKTTLFDSADWSGKDDEPLSHFQKGTWIRGPFQSKAKFSARYCSTDGKD